MQKLTTLSIVAAALLAGCLADTPAQENAADATGGNAPAPGAGAAAGSAAGGLEADAEPVFLHMTADGALSLDPAAAGTVPYPEPVNSPMAQQSAIWTGPVAIAGNVSAEVPVRIFITTNGAALAARMIPPFMLEDLPGLWVSLRIGEFAWHGNMPGPDFLHVGQVIEVAGVLVSDGAPVIEPGATAELEIQVAYTHFRPVSELQFAVGPDQPAGVELSPR